MFASVTICCVSNQLKKKKKNVQTSARMFLGEGGVGLTSLSGCLARDRMGRFPGPSLTAAPSVKQLENGSSGGN